MSKHTLHWIGLVLMLGNAVVGLYSSNSIFAYINVVFVIIIALIHISEISETPRK